MRATISSASSRRATSPDKVAAENKCPAWMHVREIMTTDLVTVTPDRSLHDCLRLMEANAIYHLLVLDDRGTYRGMLSVSDLLKVIASDEKARADMLEAARLRAPRDVGADPKTNCGRRSCV